jgi:hypothetical protein
MTTNLRLQVLGKIPQSQNARDKWSWQKRHRESKEWKKQIGLSMLVAGIKPPKYKVVDIKIQRHCVRSIRDEDNYWGGCKPVIDALVTNGIILEDTPENIRHRQLWQTRCSHKKFEGTTITITPVVY